MLADVLRMRKVFQDALRCYQMLKEVVKCYKLFKMLSNGLRSCKV